jgi:hypothetical protein
MNYQCFLALLFFIKLGFWDHRSGRWSLCKSSLLAPAECYNVGNAVTTILNYNPSGNMSLVTEDTVWKPTWLKVRTWRRYCYNFKFWITTDLTNTDLKLDTLKFCIFILLFALWYITRFSTKIACDLCIFSLFISQTRENIYANPKYLVHSTCTYTCCCRLAHAWN